MDKLITFAVPCYNSAAYMDHCVETLLQGGDDIEIILVDDGSTKDDTPAICDRYAQQYPDIVRAIHQENGGHGEGVNQGIRNARGVYYKVVDSDDWVDVPALKKALDKLRQFVRDGKLVDMIFMVAVPPDRQSDHLLILARLVNLLSDHRLTEKLRMADTREAFIRILNQTEAAIFA